MFYGSFGCVAVVDLKIVFLPLLAFEVAILVDNVRYSINVLRFGYVSPLLQCAACDFKNIAFTACLLLAMSVTTD